MGKGNKQVKKKKHEVKSKKKKTLLIISIIVLICIIGILWFIFNLGGAVKAQLIIESGVVEIKHEGDDWLIANNGMILYQSDIIRTGNNTEASVILFESSIIRLDNNTEIILKELITEAEKTSITIQQNSGRTWNTVLKVSGIDDYEVQTPTSVASVRGTVFDVHIHIGNKTDVGVGRGVVFITKIIDGNVLGSIELKMDEMVSIFDDDIDQIFKIVYFLKDDWVLRNQEKDEDFTGDVKDQLYKRMDPYIDDIKERWKVTDDELDVLVTGYVNGNFDLPPDTPEWIRDLMEFS